MPGTKAKKAKAAAVGAGGLVSTVPTSATAAPAGLSTAHLASAPTIEMEASLVPDILEVRDVAGGVELTYESMERRYRRTEPPTGIAIPPPSERTYAELFEHRYKIDEEE